MANSLDDLRGQRHFDYIVAGCGGIGSGAVYWLSKRAGHSVLGLEKFSLGHSFGGSQDVSRITRLMYDDDIYVDLAINSFKAWAAVEAEAGMQLVYKAGLVNLVGTEGQKATIANYADIMSKAKIPYEIWDNKQLMQRFPQFSVDDNHVAIWQKDGGIVDAALANTLHRTLAQGRGAKILDNSPINKVARLPSGLIEVSTPKGVFTCKKLVVTAGAWINQILSHLGCHVPVYVMEENVTYFGTPYVKDFVKEKFPSFSYYHRSGKRLYGMPAHVIGGPKIGIDVGGPVVTGDTRSFTPDPARLQFVTDVCKEILPKFLGPVLETKSCLYTMTPDRHFLIDTCHKTGFPDVAVCCGAGHAFKFASILGQVLSELAIDGKTHLDISNFSWDRKALTDPNFEPTCFIGRDDLPQTKSRL